MQCSIHHETSAHGMCTKCGQLFCKNCIVDVGGAYQCRNCLENINNPDKSTYKNEFNSFNGIPYKKPDKNNRDGKLVIWIVLMMFFPVAGIFAGKFEPFGRIGNIICRVIGWMYVVTFIIFFLLLFIGAMS